ncbi:hypothetical protein Moror_8176 [Moniliophthora roreri MCA 2997]|uniref:DUF6699 domain-containing protein n=2 Tax=Moniliophthora roreri TaxID=221103 RepID=V2XNE1_MONRO|nr:hypothetical protein Moror_8176 [Moniliophthora roreri MCA 2997]
MRTPSSDNEPRQHEEPGRVVYSSPSTSLIPSPPQHSPTSPALIPRGRVPDPSLPMASLSPYSSSATISRIIIPASPRDSDAPKPPALARVKPILLPSQLDLPYGVEIRLHRRLRIQNYSHDSPYYNACLTEAATQPPLPSMTLILPDLPQPIITVHRSTVNPAYVTVYDVLAAIGQVLNRNHRHGWWLRRNNTTRFVGLRKSEAGGDIWELVFTNPRPGG